MRRATQKAINIHTVVFVQYTTRRATPKAINIHTVVFVQYTMRALEMTSGLQYAVSQAVRIAAQRRCMASKSPSCCTCTVTPRCAVALCSSPPILSNGTAEFSASTSIIMTKLFCMIVCYMSSIFIPSFASLSATAAIIPTLSVPITETTAFILRIIPHVRRLWQAIDKQSRRAAHSRRARYFPHDKARRKPSG